MWQGRIQGICISLFHTWDKRRIMQAGTHTWTSRSAPARHLLRGTAPRRRRIPARSKSCEMRAALYPKSFSAALWVAVDALDLVCSMPHNMPAGAERPPQDAVKRCKCSASSATPSDHGGALVSAMTPWPPTGTTAPKYGSTISPNPSSRVRRLTEL